MAAAQKAAAIDGLTGIMNCKSFRKNIAEILKNMSAGKCGILIDGDHFKRINDTCGHTAGDDVIRLVAQMIVGRIRTVDLASRLHGDEFAIFLSDIQVPVYWAAGYVRYQCFPLQRIRSARSSGLSPSLPVPFSSGTAISTLSL